ncbi:ABC transporter ATP-binding protein [Candidatus Omnitrophota bacterium]
MKNYIKLLKYLKPHVIFFVPAIVCMGFSALFDGVTITMVAPFTDRVLSDGKIIVPFDNLPLGLSSVIEKINNIPRAELLTTIAVTILILFLLKGFFFFWQSYLMSNIGQRVVRDMRLALYKKFQDLSLDYYSKKRSGELISRITNDVMLVENAVSYGVTDLIYQSLQVVFFTCLIFFIHWKFALISFVLFPLVAGPMVSIGRMLKKLAKSSQEKMADINSLLYETISGVRIVKAFCMEEYETKRFAAQNKDFYKITMKSIRRNLILGPLTEFIGAFCGVGIFFFGVREVINETISFGVFGLFLGGLFSLIRPCKKLSQVNAIIQKALAASERIHDVLEAQPTVREKTDALVIGGVEKLIEFKDVWFRYEEETAEVLRDINLTIHAGELIAIVGPTGAGKTTLVNLIPRFYDPTKGKINIDGIDVKDMNIKSLRSQVAVVTQETILFNDTVKANISYGSGAVSDEKVRHAAVMAFAHNFIMKMPEEYNTIVGDRGFKLSGGEKQRLTIARAILKNPPILILDEATSQLDSESERYVQEALDHLVKNRTVFCIAHRLSTIRKANKIIVLDEGKIVDIGKHQELLSKSGLYKRLYETQFKM